VVSFTSETGAEGDWTDRRLFIGTELAACHSGFWAKGRPRVGTFILCEGGRSVMQGAAVAFTTDSGRTRAAKRGGNSWLSHEAESFWSKYTIFRCVSSRYFMFVILSNLLLKGYWATYTLTTRRRSGWSRVFLDKLIVAHIPRLLWNRNVHYHVYKRRHWTLPWARWLHYTSMHLSFLRSMFISAIYAYVFRVTSSLQVFQLKCINLPSHRRRWSSG
jgi:hypothetical protein